ncbi:MAG: GIY-YIG nuclease family protein [Bacteroidetes bacterium SB0662_bin_6]|nr:GIY-YIG nuclease family protein [Bacteroidetes bacterium SB0668_bin_1]MYE03488.1 GIY-YIG nuclease family protein [Bacteroidetes bacterium SB0662_bin_6]
MPHRPGMSSESSRIDILQGNILASFWMIENFDKRRKEYKKLGWIYAARNPSFVDPVFKVGVSSRPPLARMQELSASTSVYRGFDLAYFVHVTPRDIAEKWAHEALKEFRINPRKEFFQAPLPVVVKALGRVAEIFPVPLGKTPRAGYLEQPLQPRPVSCPHCGMENRVPGVLVQIRISCGACKSEIMI